MATAVAVPATSSTAGETPAAAEQASTAALHSQPSFGTSDATDANHMVTQAASEGQTAGKEASPATRRSSRRHAGKNEQLAIAVASAASAGVQQQSTDKPTPDSSKLADADDSLPALSEVHPAQTGVEQVARPHAAAAPLIGRRTRAANVGRGNSKASITVQEPTGSQERQSDAEQSMASDSIGDRAGSERNKRLSARRQRAAPKPTSRLGRGQSPFALSLIMK